MGGVLAFFGGCTNRPPIHQQPPATTWAEWPLSAHQMLSVWSELLVSPGPGNLHHPQVLETIHDGPIDDDGYAISLRSNRQI